MSRAAIKIAIHASNLLRKCLAGFCVLFEPLEEYRETFVSN